MNQLSIDTAMRRIAGKIKKTPIIQSDLLDSKLGKGYKLYLKCENFQITRSYKPRGALNALMSKQPSAAVARSSGNFGQALAWAGTQLGVEVSVVIPEDAPASKIKGVKRWGGQVYLAPPSYEEQYAKVDELLQKIPGAISLSPFDDYDVISGQATVAQEVLEQLPEFKYFFAPIGGGGLMAGCAAAIKQSQRGVTVIGVEPEGANDYYLSRQQGRKYTLQRADTIADGLRSPSVGSKNFPILNQCVDEVKLVSDKDIVQVMKILFETVGMVVEPSGAAALAALTANPDWEPDGDMVFVLSGGNVDSAKFLDFITFTN